MNINHVRLLSRKSQEICGEYMEATEIIAAKDISKIYNHHTFMIVSTRPKPKSCPADMKPMVVTKWNNQ